MRIAHSEGRLSHWEDLLSELDLPQLQVLDAYYRIEPWGEARADLREAVMATSIAAALSLSEVTSEEFAERVERLRNYLTPAKEELVSPNAAAAMMTTQFPGRS